MRLVCDPDRVFGSTPNTSLIVEMPKEKDPKRIVFLARNGQQAHFVPVNGIVLMNDQKPEEWRKMLDMIKKGGEFAVVTANDSMTFELEPIGSLRCE